MGIIESLGLSVLGIAVVFFGLICLMVVIIIMGALMKQKKAAPAPAATPAPAPKAEPVYAPGSAGDILLYNVEPKTAAMLMAITADKLGKPINELRFISVKCLDEDK